MEKAQESLQLLLLAVEGEQPRSPGLHHRFQDLGQSWCGGREEEVHALWPGLRERSKFYLQALPTAALWAIPLEDDLPQV